MAAEVLSVSLNDGFEDDAVTVLLDGREVFASGHVSTRHEISRAAGFTVPLTGDGEGALTVVIPERGIEETIPLDPNARFLSLSVRGSELNRRFSEAPFRSM
jgi:hypothetical protein